MAKRDKKSRKGANITDISDIPPDLNIDEQKTKKKKRARFKRRTAFLAFILIFGIITINWDKLSPVAVLQRCQAIANSKGERNNYPADIAQHKINGYSSPESFGFIAADAGCFLLKDSAAYFYSYKLSSPAVKTGIRNAAVYEYGGSKFTVFSEDGQLFLKESKNPLKSMAVAKNGIYALLTCPTQFSCELTVYSVTHKVLASQYFNEPNITDAALSSSAQKAAVTKTDTENGRITSSVIVYDTRLADPVFTDAYEGELILEIKYDKNDELRVITDRAAYLYTAEQKLSQRYEFAAKLISYCITSEGNIAVMLDTQNVASGKIITLIVKNSQNYSVNVAYNSRRLWADNKNVTFLAGKSAFLLNSKGEHAGSYDCGADAKALILTEKSAFFNNGQHISRIPVSDFKIRDTTDA